MKESIIKISIWCYSSLLTLVYTVAIPFLKKKGEKKGWCLKERLRYPYMLREFRNRTVVWVHAASLGEAKLLYKFLETLQRRHPEDLYLVTATTRSGKEYLEQYRPQSVIAAGILPFDSLRLMRGMLEKFSVTRLWLMETEIWPSMLLSCREMEIPVGIVNARIEEKSFESYKKFRPVLGYLFSGFDLVLAQTEIYAQRFIEMGVSSQKIHIVGNIKSHVQIHRPPRNEWLEVRKNLNINENALVLTAGCIHPDEGAVLRETLKILAELGHDIYCIVVPRHLSAAGQLVQSLGSGVLHLTDISTAKKWKICLIEKLGILEEMYKVADAALVGGTFNNVGGHNVWDPARFGIPVFFGPDYHTQTESCERLLSAGVGFKADNARALAQVIHRVLRTDARKFIDAQLLFMDTINKRDSILEPLLP